ncbi:MAG TPA: SpoIIE family protein phosphatase [Pirellulaceae bacterium]|nr:SpoIIE family protein phosphatase [Pirellulaceae bacterium]
MAKLVLLDQPGSPAIDLPAGETTLGRRADNGIVIVGETVSGRHAKIVLKEGVATLQDLGSTNGTLLNGIPVQQPTRIADRDLIHLGKTQLRFEGSQTARGRSADNELLSSIVRRPGATPSPGRSDATAMGTIIHDEPAEIRGTSENRGRFGALSSNSEAKLRAIIEIGQRLRGTHEIEEILPAILDTLFGVFPSADRGCILLREESGELVPHAMKHRDPRHDATIRLSRTIVRHVLDTKAGVLSADASMDSKFTGSESISDLQIRSMMCAPLLSSDDQVLGILSIDSQNPLGQFTQEDLDVLMSVAGQAAVAYENAELLASYVRQKKQDSEMQIAREIQHGLLPTSLPTIPGYEFFASYEAAQAVGGDYFDVFRLPEGRICFSFGDVAGKGVPGALIMSRMHSCVQSTLKHVHEVEPAILAINEHMCDTAVEGRFVTYVLAILDPAAGTLTLSNAGHFSPIIRHADGSIEAYDDELVGPPIGVMDGYPYEIETRTLAPGDVVVLVTDGVNEAHSPQDEIYGDDRVREFIRNGPGTAAALGQALLDDVRRHAAGRDPFDDITIMTIGRTAE